MFKYKHSIKNGIQSTGHKFRFGRGKFHHPLPETEILLYLQYENPNLEHFPPGKNLR